MGVFPWLRGVGRVSAIEDIVAPGDCLPKTFGIQDTDESVIDSSVAGISILGNAVKEQLRDLS